MRLVSVPAPATVAFPSGTETKLQHVPLQLTRFPTTVDQTRSTLAPGVRPAAETLTFESTWPDVELSRAVAVAPGGKPAETSSVRQASARRPRASRCR